MDKRILYTVIRMLSSLQRREGMKVIALLCISSVLDFFSLAFFLPIILLVVNPEQAFENNFVVEIYRVSGFSSHSSFVIGITISVIGFLFIKTQISRWIIHRKASFAYGIANDLAASKLDQYLHSGYAQFTSTDFSKQSNQITNLPLTFANNIIIPSGTIFSEGIVALLLLTGIILFDSRAFLFLTILFAPLVIIYLLKRKTLKNISQKIKRVYPLLLKYTMQSVEGWAEIKSMNKQPFFKNKFITHYKQLTGTFTRAHITNTSPARITELVAALCVGALIIYSLWSRQPYQQTLLLLSVYAGVSFRIIPSLNRIFAALLQIKSHEYVVQELSASIGVQPKSEQESTPISFQEKIQLSGISFGYDHPSQILNNLSLTIRKGERVMITGKSGSGKTSLLLILMRFLKETNGEISIDNVPLKEKHCNAWQKCIGYVPQNPYLLDGSITENIAFGIPADEIDFDKVSQAAEQAELTDWIKTLPEKTDSLLGEKGAKISGGQRQRIALARAFYHDAVILLLDESTNQLDAQTEAEIAHTILQNSDSQKTIIMISHHEKLWEQFDSIYELSKGKLEKRFSKALANQTFI